jgi:hypothetical protein
VVDSDTMTRCSEPGRAICIVRLGCGAVTEYTLLHSHTMTRCSKRGRAICIVRLGSAIVVDSCE